MGWLFTLNSSEEFVGLFPSSWFSLGIFEDATARLNFWATILARNATNKNTYIMSLINLKLLELWTSVFSSLSSFSWNLSQRLFSKWINNLYYLQLAICVIVTFKERVEIISLFVNLTCYHNHHCGSETHFYPKK